jgi:HlyD family secretion protein
MSETAPAQKTRKRKSSWPQWVFILVLLAAAGGGGYWYYKRSGTKPVEYRTAVIARGEVTQSVTANGQLVAVKNVQVGSQISGIITEINVDFNAKVKKDEVIAKIDPSTYERNLSQTEAELANATAGLELAEFNFKQAKSLYTGKLISESEYNRAEVDLHQAQAVVKMRQANVERSKVDLERTVIMAPMAGIVISRNIEVGQTVAASFNTPTLFLIANDLSKMQIEAAVSEADVGGVEENQAVNFSVEAYTRQFRGQVKQIRYAPITNQNVVTYTAIVEVDNPDLKLRPGMTATASIITAQKQDVIRIPNAAFRFRPPEGAMPKSAAAPGAGPGSSTKKSTNAAAANVATSGPFAGLPEPPWRAERRRPTPEEQEKYSASLTPEQREQYRQISEQMRAMRGAQGGGGRGGGEGGGGGGGFGGPARIIQEGPRTQTVYLLEKDTAASGQEKQVLKPVTVKTGIADATNAEVLEGLKEGDVVVIGVISSDPLNAAMRPPGGSPFGGPFGGGRRGF